VATFIALPGIWNSQSNTLVIGLLLLATSCLIRELWWSAACLLAGAVWLKLTPIAPALLLCALRPRRMAGPFAASLLAISLSPFLRRPPDIVLGHYADWMGGLLSSSATRWPGFRDGWTVWMATTELFQEVERPFWLVTPVTSLWYRAVQLLTGLGALAWCLWNNKQGTSPRWLFCTSLGMGLAWMMLFGAAVEHTTYALLAPSLAWALHQQQVWRPGRWLAFASFVLIAVLGWDPLIGPLLKQAPVMAAVLPLGAGVFIIWMLAYVRRCGPSIRLGIEQSSSTAMDPETNVAAPQGPDPEPFALPTTPKRSRAYGRVVLQPSGLGD